MRDATVTRRFHHPHCIWTRSALGAALCLALGTAQAQSFFMQASPISQTACFGEAFNVNVQVRTSDGYIFPVKVTYPNLQPGFFLLAAAPNPVMPSAPGNVGTRLVKTTGAQGPLDLVVRGTGSNQQTAQAAVVVNMLDIPGAPLQRFPEQGFSTSTTPTLEWRGSMFAKSFRVQVANDINFTPASVVFESYLQAREINTLDVTPPLALNQTYYWRVRGTNQCGDGFDSPTFQFVTDGMCAPLDLDIPDGGADGVSAQIQLSSVANLADVDVQVISDHPRAGDLDLRVSHLGQDVHLLAGGVCNAANLAARFDDAAPTAAASACSSGTGNAIGGSLRPAQALASFNGMPVDGIWRVTARDLQANGQSGKLRGICLQTRNAPITDRLFASGMEL